MDHGAGTSDSSDQAGQEFVSGSQRVASKLQESLASELAARMNAMSSASDNAAQLKKSLLTTYNRARQQQITTGILEIVGGANAGG